MIMIVIATQMLQDSKAIQRGNNLKIKKFSLRMGMGMGMGRSQVMIESLINKRIMMILK